jgi:hypothetical protein
MSVRVKVKATGIIRTITEANYQLSKHKYELLDAPEETPKQAPQVEKKAAEPVGKEQQLDSTKYYTKQGIDFISEGNRTIERTGDDHELTVASTGVTEKEAAELAPLLTKKRPGRKPKQS